MQADEVTCSVKVKYSPKILRTKGVFGIGVGRDNETGKGYISVFCYKIDPQDGQEVAYKIPAELDGVEVRLIRA